MANVKVNAVGDQCPIPVVKATKALGEFKEAGTLEVQVDNEIAIQNLTRLADSKGLKSRSEKLGDNLFAITMEVNGPLTMGGEEKTLSGEECAFGYRTSVYQKLPCVIVKAVLQLHPGNPEEIGQTMRTLMEKRRASQPLELPSAGSTFKRPTGYFAGPLIEQAGLKGCGVGGAEVSKKHAGFVVNTGGASADDVKKTIAMVQSRVWEASGVQLEPEVRIW